MDELLSLKWSNHSPTFLSVLSSLREKQLYTDVTLACDGKFYNAHKLVLSTCSDYFSAMLDRTNCNNPVIVLKDIKCEDLEALLDYMYLGEVNVRQSDLATLIKAAECLRVKGLAVPDDEPPLTNSCVSEQHIRIGDTCNSPPAKRKRRNNTEESKDKNTNYNCIGTRGNDAETGQDMLSPARNILSPTADAKIKREGASPSNDDIYIEEKPITAKDEKAAYPTDDSNQLPDFLLPTLDGQASTKDFPQPMADVHSPGVSGSRNWSDEADRTLPGSAKKSTHPNLQTTAQNANRTTGGRLLYELSDSPKTSASNADTRVTSPVPSYFPESASSSTATPTNSSGYGSIATSDLHYSNIMSPPSQFRTTGGIMIAPAPSADQLGIPFNNQLSTQDVLQSPPESERHQSLGELASFSDSLFYATGEHSSLPKGLAVDAGSSHGVDSDMKCPYCCKVFNFQSKLDRHIRAHTNERPFQCKYCHYSAKHRDNLKTHCYLKHKSIVFNEQFNS